MVKVWCLKLAITALISSVGGCSQIPANTTATGEKPVISSYSVPETSEPGSAKDSESETPIVIWQYQDLEVKFNRFSENVGYLNLGMTNKDAPSYVMNGHFMYCLSGGNGSYELRRIDLDQLEKSSFAKIQVSNGTVALLDFGLRINTHGETILYDFDFHEICRDRDMGEEQSIVPYKDGYIVKDGKALRILHLDDENAYRTLDSENYEISGYHSTGDNTFLIMKDRTNAESKARTVYDINRNRYWKGLPENVAVSDTGLAGSVSGKYVIVNFASKDTKAVQKPSKNPGILNSSILDGGRMYFFDEADRKIKYYCPNSQKICVISEAEFLQGATLKGLYGGYVYAQYGTTIYFIDPSDQKEMTGDAYIKKVKAETTTIRQNLEFHYRIKILNGTGVTKIAEKDAKLTPITLDLEAASAMNRLSGALKKVNYRFFEVFKQSKKEGINILLSGNIDVIDGKTGVSGYSFAGQDAFYIALDARSGDIETAFLRELMHTIEHRMADADKVFMNWNNYNPQGFYYSEFIAGSAEAPYIPETEKDLNNVYFTDSYACANAEEDRARLFAAMFMPEKFGRDINSYPHIAEKASALKHVLLTYYPALSDTEALSNIK
ncbi:MAG: hypothetical protein IKW88_04340 [Clostridiales bacterium]|nr:hypothetical protein [Clostridiales bacterium]